MSAALRVRKPGLLTTVQDLGRPNAMSAGVPTGGVMDRFAHRAANLLVGNDEAAATLECTVRGPELIALRPCLVAITGADLDPHVNREPVAMWTGLFMNEGDELTFAGRRWGARAYIAVEGGIAGDRWLGSSSTYLLVERGGMHGRALIGGDEIVATAPSKSRHALGALGQQLRPDYGNHTLPVIAGPHLQRLAADT